MSIRRWSFFVVCAMLSAILLTLNGVTYVLFQTSLTQQQVEVQKQVFVSNVRLSQAFTQTIDQLVYQYTSDELLGELLSTPVGTDALGDLNTKYGIDRRISDLLNAQPLLLHHGFQVKLYVNPELEVSGLFAPANTNPDVSHVLDSGEVQGEAWYQGALELSGGQYIFLDEEQRQVCFASRLQNSAYGGPHKQDGVGVLLSSMPVSELPNLLSLVPSTENSGFLLLNQEGELIYGSQHLAGLPVEQIATQISSQYQSLTLDGEEYLCAGQELWWGLSLFFLTPYQDITGQVWGMMFPYLICSVLFLIGGIILSSVLSRSISRPVIELTKQVEGIQDIRKVNWTSSGWLQEIRQLSDGFGSLIRCVKDLIQELTQKEKLRRESDLRALQAQINPHFMLNAMNAVNYMALERGEDDIAATVNSIASLMRYSITEPDQLVTLATELENIGEYISIYTLRFRQQIQLEVSPEVALGEVVIPKFTLQPLVENSIRHGITRKDQGIQIQITVREELGFWFVEVTDSGVGADAQLLNAYLEHQEVSLPVSNGFGIRNVNQRLKLRFGDQGALRYFQGDGGRLVARLTLPKVPWREEE